MTGLVDGFVDALEHTPTPAYARCARAWRHLHTGELASCDELVQQGVVALASDGCRAERLRQAAIARLQLADLAELCVALSRVGVAYVVLKGLPLAHELYGSVALRFSGDIDLLVAPGALAPARRALLAAGHRVEPSAYAAGSVECFVCRGHGTAVEVHAELSTAEGFRALAHELLARPRALALPGAGAVPVPDRGAHLAYLLVHLARHADAPRAIWLEDIRRLVVDLGEDERARMVEVCARARVGTALHVGMSAVEAACRAVGAPGFSAATFAELSRLCPAPARWLARLLVPAVVARADEPQRRRAYSLLLAPGWLARMGTTWRAVRRRIRP